MDDLAEKKCLACEGGQPPLTSEEISSLMPGLNGGWEVVESHHLQKEPNMRPHMQTSRFGVRTALQVRSEAKKQQIHGWNVSAQGTAHSVGDGE